MHDNQVDSTNGLRHGFAQFPHVRGVWYTPARGAWLPAEHQCQFDPNLRSEDAQQAAISRQIRTGATVDIGFKGARIDLCKSSRFGNAYQSARSNDLP